MGAGCCEQQLWAAHVLGGALPAMRGLGGD